MPPDEESSSSPVSGDLIRNGLPALRGLDDQAPQAGAPATASSTDTIQAPIGMPRRAEGKQLTVLLLALLTFYSAPLLIAAGTVCLGMAGPRKAVFDQSDLVTDVLLSLAKDRNQYLGVFHQLLVPVLAAFTALDFEYLRRSRAASWLFTLPLFSLLLSILLAVIFPFFTNISEQESKVVSDLFNTMAQSLSVYVLMLVGLEGAHQRRSS